MKSHSGVVQGCTSVVRRPKSSDSGGSSVFFGSSLKIPLGNKIKCLCLRHKECYRSGMNKDMRQISVVLRRDTVAVSGETIYQVERIYNALRVDCSAAEDVDAKLVGVDDFLSEIHADNLCRCPRYQTTVIGKRKL